MEPLTEQERNITQLSYNGIPNLVNERGNEEIVQITELKKLSVNVSLTTSGSAYKAIIADGYCRLGVVMINTAAEKLDDHIAKQFSVVKILRYAVHQERSGKTVVVIQDFKTINTLVTEPIGQPISYDDYKSSHNRNVLGSGQIPGKFLKRTPESPRPPPQRVQQSSSIFDIRPEEPRLRPPASSKSRGAISERIPERVTAPIPAPAPVPPRGNRKNKQPVYFVDASDSLPVEANRFIGELAPFDTTWVIKGRVVSKGELRTWTNRKGSGQLFNIVIVDERSDEISGVFFSEAAEKFYEEIAEGDVYLFAKGQIRKEKDQEQYKIVFEIGSVIQRIEDDGTVPPARFRFTKIEDLKDVGALVDVIGVIRSLEEPTSVRLKSDEMKMRRNIVLIDDTRNSVELTIWGREAEEFPLVPGDVLIIKGAKIGDFHGRNLQKVFSTKLFYDAERLAAFLPAIRNLIQWSKTTSWEERPLVPVGRKTGARLVPTISELLAEAEVAVADGEPKMFKCYGWVTEILHERMFYPACPHCNKKAGPGDARGRIYCENCGRPSESAATRYMVQAKVSDHTNFLKVLIMDEEAKELFGRDAGELEAIQTLNAAEFKTALTEALFRERLWTVQARFDEYNPHFRVKFVIKGLEAPDFVTANATMLETLENFA
eukprot:TRINITY_DN6759_c0_g1_i10.p1 TRINITY_DN6759_c0_g1~~TRINITY_DN6759_c0_g1_i10.p1  ORF type:complete len:659 (-),score=167.71 TRINITY_DN6759_c0_g1_i10:114-2090(-)